MSDSRKSSLRDWALSSASSLAFIVCAVGGGIYCRIHWPVYALFVEVTLRFLFLFAVITALVYFVLFAGKTDQNRKRQRKKRRFNRTLADAPPPWQW